MFSENGSYFKAEIKLFLTPLVFNNNVDPGLLFMIVYFVMIIATSYKYTYTIYAHTYKDTEITPFTAYHSMGIGL